MMLNATKYTAMAVLGVGLAFCSYASVGLRIVWLCPLRATAVTVAAAHNGYAGYRRSFTTVPTATPGYHRPPY